MTKRTTLLSFLLVVTFTFQVNCLSKQLGKNTWQPRPCSSYGYQDIVMMQPVYGSNYHHNQWQISCMLHPDYMQSFNTLCNNDCSLGIMPFWSQSNIMTIGNNGVSDTNGYTSINGQVPILALPADVDGYQFGLGNAKTIGELSITPTIKHIGGNFMFYAVYNKPIQGFFLKVKAPLGAMISSLHVHEKNAQFEKNIDEQWVSYPSPESRFNSLTDAWMGASISASSQNEITLKSRLHQSLTLEKGKLFCGKMTSIRLADIALSTGLTLSHSENNFLSFGIKATLPTGTIPLSTYIFEPIFGRAGHWGLGGEITSFYKWQLAESKEFSIWMQTDFLHLFHGRSPNFRSFDLQQNGPGSKYLLTQFYFPSNTGRIPSFVTQAVNLTTLPVISSFDIEGSIACIINYDNNNWNYGLGIDFWGRSCEKITIDCCGLIKESSPNLNDFAVLGRQISENSANIAEDLFYCEPRARINKSEPRRLVPNMYDNNIKDARLSENRIPQNFYEALDIAGASEPQSISYKYITYAGYTWKNNQYSPNLKLVGGVEIAKYGTFKLHSWSIGLQNSLNF
ncbi:MAG: hypothetical protein CL947_03210 [Epsilonproteobacteria bacterium]|nr:hypothetical protein [Campylobacterota bacterium]|tara:strand:- start:4504 stop:6204 length:1701 start_codon:yes stop_codon:yes gene_type:complete